MADQEKIICSAIWFDDGKAYLHMPKNIPTGFVVCGRRHHNCFALMGQVADESKSYKQLNEVQGFLTSKDVFLDRRKAAELAFKSGQIDRQIETLFSEDLW